MFNQIQNIKEISLSGKRVLIRVDFNVPLSGKKITDDTRITASLPTIEYACEQGARVILASHLGRPKGKPKSEFSLEPIAMRLAELISVGEVILADDCIGDGPKKLVNDLREGQVILLENLRFHREEEKNSVDFAQSLASLCDVYINDAFGAVHRAHASVDALARLVQERGAGFLLERELSCLEKIRSHAPRPYVAVLGGAKVSDKIGVIEALMGQVDTLLIGGAMANTFIAAKGISVGESRIEADKLPLARRILLNAEARKVEILLPEDVRIGSNLNSDSAREVLITNIPDDQMALDIGPNTEAMFAEKISQAHCVFWNGPMGLFENKLFAQGTFSMAQAIADCEGYTVVGGGDSVAAVNQAGLAGRYSHVSTGGGASLEYIEGKILPGIEALKI